MKKRLFFFLGLFCSLLIQGEISKTVNITAGGLSSALTDVEKLVVTNLTVTGVMDAQDFKTMNDSMPLRMVISSRDYISSSSDSTF